jgi:uncharacterized protein
MNEFFQWIFKHSKPWDIQPHLSDAELEELFELMSDNEHLPKGAMSMEMADGYMTASVVGPDPLPMPWLLEAIFDQPTLPLPHDRERQQRLLRRHADIQASTALRSDEVTLDNVFVPLTAQVPAEECITPYRLDEQHERIGRWELQDWGEGFRRAIAEDDAWEPLLSDPEMGGLVSPVVLYSMGYNPDCLDLQIDEDHELLPLLSVSVCAMRSWWRDYREHLDAAAIPFQRDAPKVGRNDPCPCGSGKKYKKCCGA